MDKGVKTLTAKKSVVSSKAAWDQGTHQCGTTDGTTGQLQGNQGVSFLGCTEI